MSIMLSFPIWEKLGGRDHSIQMIEDRLGQSIKSSTVYHWIWARKLPSKIALLCLDEAHARGIPANIADCEIRGVPHYKALNPTLNREKRSDKE